MRKDCDAIPPPPPPVKGVTFYGNNTDQPDLGEFDLIENIHTIYKKKKQKTTKPNSFFVYE